MIPHARQPTDEVLRALALLTRSGFGQRRKTLHNALSVVPIVGRLPALDIDPGRRAEGVSLAVWLRLAQAMAAPPEAGD